MTTASIRRRGRSADGSMPLLEHFAELRRRAFRAALGIGIGAVAGWFATPWVLAQLRSPVTALARHGGGHTAELNFPVLSGAIDLRLQIAITVGIVLASPIWIYQVWAFIVPALIRKERRYVIGFLGTAIPLFLIGCGSGWHVLPHIVGILGSFVSRQDTSIVDAKTYYDFAVKLVVAVGVAFVLPVFVVLLNFAGVLIGVAVLHAWRIALLGILVFTAIVTPSADVASMFLLALPMTTLYFAATGICLLHDRRTARRALLAAETTEPARL
jgi:sec-independent protein translocase protein TatC